MYEVVMRCKECGGTWVDRTKTLQGALANAAEEGCAYACAKGGQIELVSHKTVPGEPTKDDGPKPEDFIRTETF